MSEFNPHDGCFPRLNAALLRQGNFNECLASFVGKFEDRHTFRCCDGGTITINDEQADLDIVESDQVFEIMGQTMDQTTVMAFVLRPLTPDTDLALYNKMIEMQHNPKFAQFFKQP